MSDRGKLGNFLREIISWDWREFCEAEKDTNYTGYQASVFSLVRACAGGKLGAIRLAIDRVDGKIETPVKFEYPRVFMLYPHAEKVAKGKGPKKLTTPEPIPEEVEAEKEDPTAATLTLRETLEKMADEPRILVQVILNRKEEVEKDIKEGVDSVNDGKNVERSVPLVKSVIAANLLHLAENNNFEAITEVFDQIDGKLVETIRILGDDMFITSYLTEAPPGAEKNEDGVYQVEALETAGVWRKKLSKD